LTERLQDAFFKALFHSPITGIAVVDLDSLMVVDANEVMLRILGRTREQLLNIREIGAEVTPAEYEERNARAIEQARERGYSDPLVKHYKRLDGTLVPVRTVFARVPEYPDRLVVFASDISEEWKQREEAAERELRLKIALSAGDQGVWDYNVETGEMIYSPRAKEIYGFPPDQPVTFEQVKDATHPDDLPYTHAQLLRAIDPAVRDRSSYEYRIVRPDGTICWAQAFGEAIFVGEPGHERAVRYIGTLLDITERKQAEEALRESENRYRNLTSVSDQVVYRHNADWSEMRQLHGGGFLADTSEPDPDWFDKYIHPDDQPHVWARIQEAIRTRTPFEYEHRVIREDGTLGWTYSRSIPIFDEQGNLVEWFGAASDVTARKEAEEALRESEERLRLAVDSAEIGFWDVQDGHGDLTWPASTKAMFGISPDVPVTMDDFYSGLHPDDLEHVAEAYAAAADPARRSLYDVEYRTIGKEDGIVRWVAAKGRGVFDGPGKDARCLRVIGTAIDITSRKRVNEALIEESRNLEILNEIGSAIASELGLERVVQMVTDAAVEITGAQFGAFFYNVEDEKGESYTLYTLSGVDRSAFENFPMPRNTHVFGPTFRGEGVVRSDDITKDPRYGKNPPYYGKPKGHLPVVSYLAVPVMGRTGDVIGGLFFGHAEPARFSERHERLIVGIAAQAAIAIDNARLYQAAQQANETLERRVSEALAERKLLADIVETTDAFVQISDPNFNFLGINKASADEFERIFGVRPKVGDNMLELLSDKPEDRAAIEAVWSRALGGEEFTEITAFGDPAGDRRYYEMKFNSLRDDDGRLIGAYQFVYDVTQRLRDQQRLLDAEEALRQSQKMEAVGQLVSGLAHDFNNVLGAVGAAFDMIRRRSEEPARVQRFAEAGMEATDRGAKLTSQLLAFSRKQRMELTPLYVCDIIESVQDLLSRTLGPLIEIELGLNPAPVPVLADPTQVEMTILNLALNARDAMPQGGKLHIATIARHVTDDPELAPGDYVELVVRDTGTGMDEETLRRAIDPFFTTKPVGKGTGLGLAQVYGSARQGGGTVRIESKPGEGTTVSVFFPRTEQPVERGMAERTPSDRIPDSTGTVLLIDDDNDLRSVISGALTTLGYSVTEAADGPSGLKALEESRPDVVVVDFAMPGLNGAEVARKARDRWPDLPIVLASGYADTAAIEQAIGRDAKLLRKPFRIDELLDAVGEAAG
jgi:PAS domain S-box-containing protein